MLVLTQCPRNDVYLVHDTISLSDTSPMCSIQSHCMDLIHERQGTIFMSHITQFLQGADSTYTNSAHKHNITSYINVT